MIRSHKSKSFLWNAKNTENTKNTDVNKQNTHATHREKDNFKKD